MAAHDTKATTNHDEIRRWTEARGGWPATVKDTGEGDEPGVLRIDFPDYSGQDTLERLDWDTFFEKFDDEELAFLYQDRLKDGNTSRFFKFVTRETARDAADEWVE